MERPERLPQKHTIWRKVWERKPEKIPRPGVIIGRRTLSDGENDYTGERGEIYKPKHYFNAYLVVFDMSTNPVYVLDFDIKKL